MGEHKLAASLGTPDGQALAPLVETSVTDELRELGGESLEFAEELLALFETKAEEDLDGMRRSLRDLDATGLSRAAHSLKGAAGNLGAQRVEGMCARLEVLGRAASFETASSLVTDLSGCLEETKAALRLVLGVGTPQGN